MERAYKQANGAVINFRRLRWRSGGAYLPFAPHHVGEARRNLKNGQTVGCIERYGGRGSTAVNRFYLKWYYEKLALQTAPGVRRESNIFDRRQEYRFGAGHIVRQATRASFQTAQAVVELHQFAKCPEHTASAISDIHFATPQRQWQSTLQFHSTPSPSHCAPNWLGRSISTPGSRCAFGPFNPGHGPSVRYFQRLCRSGLGIRMVCWGLVGEADISLTDFVERNALKERVVDLQAPEAWTLSIEAHTDGGRTGTSHSPGR